MSQPHLRDLVESDADYTKLTRYITGLLADPEKLAKIAKRSCYHTAGGFVKIILDSDETHTLRAHFWGKKYDNTADPQNPHAHGWALTSKILRGRFDNILYTETSATHAPTPETTQRNKYAISLNTHNKSCNFKLILHSHKCIQMDTFMGIKDEEMWTDVTTPSPVLLTPAHIHTYTPGQIYSMQRADIHKFVPLEDGGITLLLREKAHDDVAFTYAKTELPDKCIFTTLTKIEVANYLDAILDDVRAHGAQIPTPNI